MNCTESCLVLFPKYERRLVAEHVWRCSPIHVIWTLGWASYHSRREFLV